MKLNLQLATIAKNLPSVAQFRTWAKKIFFCLTNKGFASRSNLLNPVGLVITIKIVDEPEMAELNYLYRHKKGPTNVLSFPTASYWQDLPSDIKNEIKRDIKQEFNCNILGEIVICANAIEREAKQQNKLLLAHWAHMVVHGVLHLLGYDHEDPHEADEMECLEIKLMGELGFSSPYNMG